MLAVAPFHRIVRWLELEGTSGGLLDQFPTGGKADFKLGSGCWVRALLGQAVWSLRMEVTQSLWATCRTCSCSTAPSHPVGISFVATCACCLLCFRQMPQGRDWLHLFCNSSLGIIQKLLLPHCAALGNFNLVTCIPEGTCHRISALMSCNFI